MISRLVNLGARHASAAYATNMWAIANDDPAYPHIPHRPHPANVEASYAHRLAGMFNCQLVNEAFPTDTVLTIAEKFATLYAKYPTAYFLIEMPPGTEYNNAVDLYNTVTEKTSACLFFNSALSYSTEQNNGALGSRYYHPYEYKHTMLMELHAQGIAPKSVYTPYFNAAGHTAWARIIRKIIEDKQ